MSSGKSLSIRIEELYFQGDTSISSPPLSISLPPPTPPGKAYGESVTHIRGQMSIAEGSSLTINCTYSTTAIGYLLFSGVFSILAKAHSCSWKSLRTARREATTVLKPHTVKEPPSSTCRETQCASQTWLWVTQWQKPGGAEHKLSADRLWRLC